MHVVETQDDRVHARDLFEERRDFPLQAFLGPNRGIGGKARRRRVVL